MKISRAGIDLIKKWEGCKLTAYQDGAGVWTIGWGTTTAAGFGPITKGMKITQETADEWLVAGLPKYEAIVTKALTRSPSQSQFDAMVCLCYNVPKAFLDSTVVRQFNAGNLTAAADGFLLWNKINKGGALVASPGLMNRRMGERRLFLSVPKDEPSVPVDHPISTEKESNTMDFFLARLKAFVAIIVPGIATAVISGIEKASGFDIPASWELLILSAVTGIVVHQTPNKTQ